MMARDWATNKPITRATTKPITIPRTAGHLQKSFFIVPATWDCHSSVILAKFLPSHSTINDGWKNGNVRFATDNDF